MRPVDDYCKLFCGTEDKNVFQNMCFAKFSILYEYNSQEPEKALWHILTEDHNQNKCEVDLEMIQTEINQKFGRKQTRDEKMEDDIPESEDDLEDEDTNSDDQNENTQILVDLKKMNSTLPSKQLRWGPPKPGDTISSHLSYEIGYTKKYFTL